MHIRGIFKSGQIAVVSVFEMCAHLCENAKANKRRYADAAGSHRNRWRTSGEIEGASMGHLSEQHYEMKTNELVRMCIRTLYLFMRNYAAFL